MTLILGGKLVMAPIVETPRKVMDVATGTGIWALEFGWYCLDLMFLGSIPRLLTCLLSPSEPWVVCRGDGFEQDPAQPGNPKLPF